MSRLGVLIVICIFAFVAYTILSEEYGLFVPHPIVGKKYIYKPFADKSDPFEFDSGDTVTVLDVKGGYVKYTWYSGTSSRSIVGFNKRSKLISNQ